MANTPFFVRHGLNVNNFIQANGTTLSIGSNIVFNTSQLSVGNSTVNASVNSTGLYINGAAFSAGGTPPTTQIFTSSGTWTKPSGCKKIKVILTGGGSGGWSASPDCTYTNWGAGGAAGGTCILWRDVTGDSTHSVTIGSGGATTANGGTSLFGSILTANGGTTTGSQGSTTIGGNATGGDINLKGGNGARGPLMTITGSSYWGPGSYVNIGDGTVTNAVNYGAGGGSCTSGTPGAGKSGICVVEEFY